MILFEDFGGVKKHEKIIIQIQIHSKYKHLFSQNLPIKLDTKNL
ncbi:hypothetical protein [Borreliella garinii]|nr:hypothetical protein [Borreliella garinii]